MILSPLPGTPLKELTSAQYSQVSEFLDHAVDLEADVRSVWLDDLERHEPAWAAFLRSLFAGREQGKSPLLLETSGMAPHLFMPAALEHPTSVGRQFGAYRILSLLGRGGMGSVWLAERVDGLFTRRIALKLVHPALISPILMERSAREREILAGLTHPNIARLIDAGIADDGQPYLALEYVDGMPLTSYCDEHRLPIRERLVLFLQVLSAVKYAHGRLVIHRDLKPSNILVTREGQIYLLDFGIAKLLGAGEAGFTELTQIGGLAMTPEYASPEQIAGEPVTTAADLYSLGVMLYELLIGERPYKLKPPTRGALEEAILKIDPQAPSRAAVTEVAAAARGTTLKKLMKSIDSDLDTIILKALKKSPLERYASAAEFAEDLQRYLAHQPVLAKPDSTTYRAGKFVRRHRVSTVIAVVVLASLSASAVVSALQARRANLERARADDSAQRANEQRDLALAGIAQAQDLTGLTSYLLGEALPNDRPELTSQVLLRGVSMVRSAKGTPPERRAAMLEVLATHFENNRDFDHAAQLYKEAHAIALQSTDLGTIASTACHLAMMSTDQGQGNDALADIDQALASIANQQQYADPQIVCHLCKAEVYELQGGSGLQEVEAAARHLDELAVPDRTLEESVIGMLAIGYTNAMRVPEAIQAYERIQRLAEEAGDAHLRSGVVNFFNQQAMFFWKIGRPLDARVNLQQAQQIDSERGTVDVDDTSSLLLKARIAGQLGDLRTALAGFGRAIDSARASRDLTIESKSLAERVAMLVEAGEFLQAARALPQAEVRLHAQYPPGHWLFSILRMQEALLAEHRGNGTDAKRLADAAVTLLEANSTLTYQLPITLVQRAGIEQRAGLYAAARADAEHAIAIYDGAFGHQIRSASVGDALMAAGLALKALGDAAAARQRFALASIHYDSSLGSDHAKAQAARRLAAVAAESVLDLTGVQQHVASLGHVHAVGAHTQL